MTSRTSRKSCPNLCANRPDQDPRGQCSDGKTESPDWKDYSYILVAGQALDRGFTVEGLTVSYMPRGTGVGNADTIQQRARWFGYKEDYLGYCRVYLSVEGEAAYQAYVEHEDTCASPFASTWKRGTRSKTGSGNSSSTAGSSPRARRSFR